MITSIRLQRFRSYSDDSFEFDEGVNIIVGPNASGKTNLLEAVMVLAEGRSYRASDDELVGFNKPWARLDGYLGKQNRSIKLETLPAFKKTLLIEDKPYFRVNLERTVPMVFFEPNHLQLISRGPEQRRDYFDEILKKTKPGYTTLINQYRRALAQRNTLLKKGASQAHQQLFAWNVRLGEIGSQVASAREMLSAEINKSFSKAYSKIAGHKTKVALEYKTQFPVEHYATRLINRLEKEVQKDLERGFTSYGPHRDDFEFYIQSRPVSSSASRGETRSLVLALKIIELELVEKARGQKPIFLLDDVFSELDGARRQALVKILNKNQSILTTTDADAVLEYFDLGHKLIAL